MIKAVVSLVSLPCLSPVYLTTSISQLEEPWGHEDRLSASCWLATQQGAALTGKLSSSILLHKPFPGCAAHESVSSNPSANALQFCSCWELEAQLSADVPSTSLLQTRAEQQLSLGMTPAVGRSCAWEPGSVTAVDLQSRDVHRALQNKGHKELDVLISASPCCCPAPRRNRSGKSSPGLIQNPNGTTCSRTE